MLNLDLFKMYFYMPLCTTLATNKVTGMDYSSQ